MLFDEQQKNINDLIVDLELQNDQNNELKLKIDKIT
jgi:hypothetical protein